eukprot:TRINITY_DN2196_c0_g1_i2.p1 TRINITY_DN2196_c0_g1~~TRINITY_DN2196_c0_g1_i2.p1  ORF type:complete len:233 (-),score=25.05 TRINITY_DN2196_c0_g1_i2:595-1293(-)
MADSLPLKLSLFTNFTESPPFDGSKSPSPADFKTSLRSPRNYEGGVVGLGIVAAMNETSDFSDTKSNRPAIMAVSPRSQPIPIVSAKFRGGGGAVSVLEMEEMEMSESYTCVISHNSSVKKREYFDKYYDGMDGNYWPNPGVFLASQPDNSSPAFSTPDFLSSCHLCRKKLHGLDIFMYRGDKAFCSVECRCKQMLNDEHKEKCGSEALKPFDYSVSPCSVPRLFTAGVAAA